MLVATHKAAPVPSGDFYLPVHVGHALNPVDIGFQPDDEGQNISSLNPSYCELTALYWAWHNLDADIIGLSHYRRYFTGSQIGPNGKHILSEQEALRLMDAHDLVLGRPRNYYIETIESHYRNGHHGEDLFVLRDQIERQSPHLVPYFDHIFSGRKLSLYNMSLMRKAEFHSYCEWLFPILEGVSAGIDNDSRTQYQQRTFGYLAERLLNVWAASRSQDLRVGHRSVVNTDGEPKLQKGFKMVQRKLRRK